MLSSLSVGTSTGSAPAATTSKAASDGGGLAVESEIGSIVGAICGAITLGVTIYFGWRGLERRNENKEKKGLVAKEEEAKKAAQEQSMIPSSGHGV